MSPRFRVDCESPGYRMSELSHHQPATASDVARALEQGEFELWFQPKVRLRDNVITGAEGLARWVHPERGVLAPCHFLDTLRDAALLDRFTDQMIEQAIVFAGDAVRLGRELEVAVNLGPRSFLVPGLTDYIHSLLEAHHVPPRRLVIEITEEDLLEEGAEAAGAFEALGRLGVRLAIDDFGTGYSSLARLRRLPVDELKIDQEFVGALGTDNEDMVIVRTIIELARLLNHATVAEGIETIEQLEVLRSLGCADGQGWLFAKPMPRDQAVALIASTHQLVPQHSTSPTSDLRNRLSITSLFAAGEWGNDGIRLHATSHELSDALITDRQQLEMMTALLDIVPCCAFIKDEQARFIQANGQARAAMGVESIDAILGRTDFDVYRFDDALRFQADDLHVLTTGKPIVERTERHHRPDGSFGLMQTSKVPVRNRSGSIIGLAGFSSELTPT